MMGKGKEKRKERKRKEGGKWRKGGRGHKDDGKR